MQLEQQTAEAAAASTITSKETITQIATIKDRNKRIESDLIRLDQGIYTSEMTYKQYIREWVYNLAELYELEGCEIMKYLIFPTIVNQLRRQGLTENRIKYTYQIFEDPDMMQFRPTERIPRAEMQDVATMLSSLDTIAREQYDYDSQQYKRAISFIKNTRPTVLTANLYKSLAIEIQDMGPKVIDICNDHNINLPVRAKSSRPCGIQYDEEPGDNELIRWLYLFRDEFDKLIAKIEHTTSSYTDEEAEVWSRGIRVMVRLMRSMNNDKYARSWYEWLLIVHEKYRQSKHAASSHSAVVDTQGRSRSVTREAITENEPKMLQQASYAAEHWIGFYSLITWSDRVQNKIRASLHSDKAPILSENAIGHKS